MTNTTAKTLPALMAVRSSVLLAAVPVLWTSFAALAGRAWDCTALAST
jgi:hypothetical protein